MTVAEALQKIRRIEIRAGAPEVFETAAQVIAKRAGAVVVKRARYDQRRSPGAFQLLDADLPARKTGSTARERTGTQTRSCVSRAKPQTCHGSN